MTRDEKKKMLDRVINYRLEKDWEDPVPLATLVQIRIAIALIELKEAVQDASEYGCQHRCQNPDEKG